MSEDNKTVIIAILVVVIIISAGVMFLGHSEDRGTILKQNLGVCQSDDPDC